MGFKFSLETLKRYKKNLEGEAQREFAEAQARLRDCLAGIDRMYQAIDETRLRISRLQFSEDVQKVENIRLSEEFIRGQEIRIRNERIKARELLRISEEKQVILVERMKDHKTIAKFKDKKKEDYDRQMAQCETAEVDELVTTRSKNRRVI